jgi:hypothetical protein
MRTIQTISIYNSLHVALGECEFGTQSIRPHQLCVSIKLNYSRFLWGWRSRAGIYPHQIPCAFRNKNGIWFLSSNLNLYPDVGDADVPIVLCFDSRAYSASTWKRKEIVLPSFWNKQRVVSTFLPSSIDLDFFFWKKTLQIAPLCHLWCGLSVCSTAPCSKYRSWITRSLYWWNQPEQKSEARPVKRSISKVDSSHRWSLIFSCAIIYVSWNNSAWAMSHTTSCGK